MFLPPINWVCFFKAVLTFRNDMRHTTDEIRNIDVFLNIFKTFWHFLEDFDIDFAAAVPLSVIFAPPHRLSSIQH